MQEQNRQLAAILFTDIVGYTAMMQQEEPYAVAVTRHYITVIKEAVAAHHGKILNDYGDGSLCSFSSATEAMRCAIEMQQQMQTEPRVPLRIGLHVGELFFEGSKVMGDGVNVASRIQSLGQANTILFSKEVFDKLKNQPEFKCVSVGRFHFKNVDEPMEVFAMANEGLVVPDRRKMEGKLQERKSSNRRIILAASFLLLAVASFFVYSKYFNKTEFTGNEKSIAIIPFDVFGNDADNISVGFVDDILVHLSKIRELNKVISNRSSSKYAGTKKSPVEIGQELNVNSLGTGSIQVSGDSIRVSAQLIDCKTGKVLWADNDTKGKRQIFDLETEVAAKFVKALKATLTPQEEKGLSKRYTENIEAYKLYRTGRAFWNAEGKENFDSAEANYRRAIQLDPDYALAYAGLADCYSINIRKGQMPLERVPIAKLYAAKALSLDSELSEALTATAFIQQIFDYEWAKAKKNLEKAIDLDPNNSIAHMNYGLVLMHSTADKNGALRELKKAVDLDPLSNRANWILSRNYYFAGNYDLAIDQFKKTKALSPNNLKFIADTWMGFAYFKKHLYKQAKEAFDLCPEESGDRGYCYALMGDKAKAMTWLENKLKESAPYHYGFAMVDVALGNFDEAMKQLELGYENRNIQMFWLPVDPAFDPIRNDPRFKALLKKMNLD